MMDLHVDNWVLDDSHPKKAGRYFTVHRGVVSITSYSKRTFWGGTRVDGWCKIDVSKPFAALGQQLAEESARRWQECNKIVIVGDDGKPLKVA